MKCQVCGSVDGKILRSTNQNSYYWKVIVSMLSEHTGFTPEDMHEVLKHKFLKKEVLLETRVTGGFAYQEIGITKSTTSLTTSEFESYCTQIREWASSELCVSIPEPNEETK